MRRALASSLPLLALLVFAGCSLTSVGSGQEMRVTAAERGGTMSLKPEVITVRVGAEVTFAVENEGSQDHEFESPEAGIEEILIPPGRTRRVGWTAPSEPGVFPVYCDLPGHREAGMELTLQVVASAQAD
jgi:uncharacterized cupredoxin-like copper-binding protein